MQEDGSALIPQNGSSWCRGRGHASISKKKVVTPMHVNKPNHRACSLTLHPPRQVWIHLSNKHTLLSYMSVKSTVPLHLLLRVFPHLTCKAMYTSYVIVKPLKSWHAILYLFSKEAKSYKKKQNCSKLIINIFSEGRIFPIICTAYLDTRIPQVRW